MPVEDYESFIREAALMRKLKHKYIIDYVGIGGKYCVKDHVSLSFKLKVLLGLGYQVAARASWCNFFFQLIAPAS